VNFDALTNKSIQSYVAFWWKGLKVGKAVACCPVGEEYVLVSLEPAYLSWAQLQCVVALLPCGQMGRYLWDAGGVVT